MSSSVDSRIVTMKFDNAQFERGVHTTMDTLGKLEDSLKMTGATRGLSELQGMSGRFNFGPLETGISHLSASFVAMSTVAITALSNITTKAVDAGLQLAKSLTIDPIKAGFDEYELKLGSIQTILANTSKFGTNLGDVTTALNDLNAYSDQTIYNFGDMTKNIGLFTNAGIKLEDATSMIKGFSNAAAASGTSAEGASGAAYQLSQALSAGKITLMDWKSLTNVGMGNKNMQTGIIDIAKAMGTFKGSGTNAKEAADNFNSTLEKGWLTADVMSNYLQIMAGDMDEAKMKSLGLSEATIKTFQTQQKTAEDAATKVRTFTQLMGTLKESVGSGWSQTFETVIGNFDEATDLFTEISSTIGSFVQDSSNARNKVLEDWKKLGGRTVLIDAIKKAFGGLFGVIKPIQDAFREIFPPRTGADLMKLTTAFRNFTEKLKVSKETADNLKRTFKGVFAFFSIIGQIVHGVITVFGQLAEALFSGSGGFLTLTANLGDILVAIDTFLKKGHFLESFFSGLGAVLALPIRLLKAFAGFIGDLFGEFNLGASDKVSESIDKVADSLNPFEALIERIGGAFAALGDVFGDVGDALRPIARKVGEAVGAIWDAFKQVFSTGNFSLLLDTIETGFFGVLVLSIKKFLKGGIFGGTGAGGVMDSIRGSFDALTGSLKAMQQNIKADTLIKIAIAVGILAVSIIALAMVDPEKLKSAMTAIGVAFAQLLVAMKIMEKIGDSKGFYKMPVVATAMILFSVAVLVLTAAVKVLSKLSWEELAKGLGALVILVAAITTSANVLSKSSGNMIKASIGIFILVLSLKALVKIIKDMAALDVKTIGLGLLEVAVAIGVISTIMRLLPKDMEKRSTGMLILAVALKLLASALSDFGKMDWGTLVKGMVGMAGVLGGIALAMNLMPATSLTTAVTLVIVAGALKIIAEILQDVGQMDWGAIGKGMVVLAGSLAIIAVALMVMQGSLAGAAALAVAAASLVLVALALKEFDDISWGAIGKGLTALAVALTIIGVAGYLLAPVVPVFLGLATAALMIGAAMLLGGAGLFLFASAIALVISMGDDAAEAIDMILQTAIDKIPAFFEALGQGMLNFIKKIIESAAEITTAFVTIIEALAQAFIDAAPKIEEAVHTFMQMLRDIIVQDSPKWKESFITLIRTFIEAVVELQGDIVEAGWQMLKNILEGIRDHIDEMVDIAGDIVIEFIDAVANKSVEIAAAGADAIIDFMNGMADAIDDNAAEMGQAGRNIADSIAGGLIIGLDEAIPDVVQAAMGLGGAAIKGARNALDSKSPSKAFMRIGEDVGTGFRMGLEAQYAVIDQASARMGDESLIAMKTTMEKMADMMTNEVNLTPVITPVIDMSNLQKDASKLNSLLATQMSYNQAVNISATQRSAEETANTPNNPQPATMINFEQNNYSPTALSDVQIYRQTKNQLSLAKEALNV